MDLVKLAHYPFLPEVRDAVREQGIGLDDVLSSVLYNGVRERALARVRAAMGQVLPPVTVLDDRAAVLELLSVPIARMLTVRLGEKILRDRYAAMEAGQVQQYLNHDDDEAVTVALETLGIAAVDEGPAGWRLHVTEYLRLAPAGPDWKLVVRAVAAGHVRLQRPELIRLVRESLAKRIVDELEAEAKKPLPDAVITLLAPLEAKLKPELEEARADWNTGDFGPVQPDLFPPCMKEIFDALRRGENLPHHGRFAFATFLHTVGWNAEQILDYLSTTPNFDREKSRYQIEHVSGEKGVQAYTPPGCATMQTNGVCPLDRRDALCFKIKHPLNYYRAQLRFQKKDAEAAAARSGPAPRQGATMAPTAQTPTAAGPPSSPPS